MLIRLATGQQAGTRTWSEPWHFGIGCRDEPTRADLSAGVVFTANADTVEMWYPDALTTPIRQVSLG